MSRDDELNRARYSTGRTYMEPKRYSFWWDMFKIGIGFVVGSALTFAIMVYIGYHVSFRDIIKVTDDDPIESPLVEPEPVYDKKPEVRYFQVRSKDKYATIHTGMSKDSVILLLGQPTEFMSTSYIDEITYRYGKYNLNSLSIEFKKGKVSSVIQH